MNFTALSKTALGSFVQHFRINCICTANPKTPTLLSLCFFEKLSGSCLKVGVLFTLLLLSGTEGRSGVDIQWYILFSGRYLKIFEIQCQKIFIIFPAEKLVPRSYHRWHGSSGMTNVSFCWRFHIFFLLLTFRQSFLLTLEKKKKNYFPCPDVPGQNITFVLAFTFLSSQLF